MIASIIAGIAGGVAGGIIKGVAAARRTEQYSKAYKQAAENMRKAAEEYSGRKLYDKMRAAGDDMAYKQAMAAEQPFTQEMNPGQTNNAMGIANQAAQMAAGNANAAGVAGRSQGMSMEQSRNAALYDAEKLKNEQMLKQAGIDFNRSAATTQAALNMAQGLTSMGKNMFANAGGGKE